MKALILKYVFFILPMRFMTHKCKTKQNFYGKVLFLCIDSTVIFLLTFSCKLVVWYVFNGFLGDYLCREAKNVSSGKG